MFEINPYWNRIFHIVAETKSFTKASDILGIKKTTVSNNINQLEQALNVKLFYRDNKGVRLTASGQTYFEFVDKALAYLDAGEKLVKANNDIDTGKITVGSLSHISHFYLIEKLIKMQKEHPKLDIKLLTGATGENLIELLERHKIDFAVDSTTMSIRNKDIKKEELKKVENIFISNEPLEIKELKELENMKLILGIENTKTTQELIDLMKMHNVNIRSNIKIDITELKIDVVKLGYGIAYVMRDSVKRELERKELYEVKLPIELPTSSLNLLYLKGQLTNIDKKFIKDYLKK